MRNIGAQNNCKFDRNEQKTWNEIKSQQKQENNGQQQQKKQWAINNIHLS